MPVDSPPPVRLHSLDVLQPSKTALPTGDQTYELMGWVRDGRGHLTFKPFILKRLGYETKSSSSPPKFKAHVPFTKYPPNKTYHDSRDTTESVCISEFNLTDCLIHVFPGTHFFLLGNQRIILHLNLQSIAHKLCVMLYNVAWG